MSGLWLEALNICIKSLNVYCAFTFTTYRSFSIALNISFIVLSIFKAKAKLGNMIFEKFDLHNVNFKYWLEQHTKT